MNAEVAQGGIRVDAMAVGMNALAWMAAITAALAVLIMWTLLSAPAEVATAAAEGVPELVGVVLSAVYDGIVALLAWL